MSVRSEREPPPLPLADLRLLSAAAGSWVGALGGSVLPLVVCWWISACALVAAVLTHRRRTAAIGLTLLMGGLVVTAIGRHSRLTGPVGVLAAREGAGHVELTVRSDPQPLPPQPHLPPEVIFRADVRRVEAAGKAWAVNQPVLVLAPASLWADLLPSTKLSASAEVRPPDGADIAAVIIVRRPPVLIRGPSLLQRWAGRVRAGLRQAASGLPASERGLLPGLVVGDTSRMPPTDVAAFKAAGLTHLTAVSGANLAIVVGATFGLLRFTPCGIRMRAATSAVVLIGFVVLARPTPSVLRAAVMGLLALLAIGLGRPRALLPALLAAVTGLLLLRPTLAAQPGFALSVAATLGLIVLVPGWVPRLKVWLPGRCARLAPVLAVPLAAQAACVPVIAAIGKGVSLAAIPANLLALPAVAAATVLGLAAAVMSLFAAGPAAAVCAIAGWPCRWLIAVAHLAPHLPLATLGAPSGGWGLCLVAAAVVAVAAAVKRPGGRRTLILAASILMIALAAGAA